jgi:hypothetical protein
VIADKAKILTWIISLAFLLYYPRSGEIYRFVIGVQDVPPLNQRSKNSRHSHP